MKTQQQKMTLREKLEAHIKSLESELLAVFETISKFELKRELLQQQMQILKTMLHNNGETGEEERYKSTRKK